MAKPGALKSWLSAGAFSALSEARVEIDICTYHASISSTEAIICRKRASADDRRATAERRVPTRTAYEALFALGFGTSDAFDVWSAVDRCWADRRIKVRGMP